MGNSTLTMAEKMNFAGETIALGLLVVFTCLVLLILVITILSAVLKDRKKKAASAPETKLEKALTQPLPQAPVLQVQDDELLAVLTAAVAAAMEAEQTATPFVIRSYKRSNRATAWNRAGRDTQINNW
ncbi:MAG: OadG family protein [Christensenella sp.]|nr:OadG family protein [Christensenella sp.]